MAAKHVLLLLFLALARRAAADAVISGTVFCDQCRDGHVSLFDYPLSGAKVAVTCMAGNGQDVTGYAEQTTSFVGTFKVTLEGSLGNTSGCFAHVAAGPSGCNAGVGSPQGLKLLFRLFGTEFYAVDPLLSQPPEPMSFCQRSRPSPSPPSPDNPPKVVPSPPVTRHPLPAFACSHEAWTEPEHECHWNLVSPKTKVAMAFGPIAAQKYGTEMTLWEGLQGKGELYRTLLREGTTALLNSYSSLRFYYPTLMIMHYMNRALLGSPSDAMEIAVRFTKANSGAPSYGGGKCSFRPCS